MSKVQHQRGDYVEFIAGTHKGVRGQVIQVFKGQVTVMQANNVAVMDVAAHAIKLDAPTPTATAERSHRPAVS